MTRIDRKEEVSRLYLTGATGRAAFDELCRGYESQIGTLQTRYSELYRKVIHLEAHCEEVVAACARKDAALRAFRNVDTKDCDGLLGMLNDIETRMPSLRCDACDNGIADEWLFCPYCGHPQTDDGIEAAQRELNARDIAAGTIATLRADLVEASGLLAAAILFVKATPIKHPQQGECKSQLLDGLNAFLSKHKDTANG
jgi:hypothetical protein